MNTDILAIGAHPDDVELGCGGTVALHAAAGRNIAILDLTRGELGTRGNAELRLEEAREAARILGVKERVNLALADGFFRNDRDSLLALAARIRQFRPRIILAPARSDRHPDHGRAAAMVKEAVFLAGLPKVETRLEGNPQEPWRTPLLLHYIQDYYHRPDIVVDISQYFEQKMKAVLAFRSQFHNPDSTEPETPISRPEFLEALKARAIEYGRAIGATYGEGFNSNRLIGTQDLFGLM